MIALLLSGLAEAVSFAAMIPLLGMALLQDQEDGDQGFLAESVNSIFDFIGIEMTLGGILIFVVILMGLKLVLFSYYAQREVGYICTDVEADFKEKYGEFIAIRRLEIPR